MNLTIAYFTNRPDPKIRWFFDSLHRETGGDYSGIKVVVVDFFAHDRMSGRLAQSGGGYTALMDAPCSPVVVAPKPTVWQGPHRLTTQDYFAASNARNTAICHAPDGYIAFVDDLSVLLPGWLNAVREAMAGGYIALGAYKKQKQLVVENGNVVSFEEFPLGVDSRWNHGNDSRPVTAAGSWMFGCSLAAPVQAFLDINGFDEDGDSMGGEDYAAGMMLEKHGYTFKYDRRMLTYESEEDHAQLPVFKRVIKKTHMHPIDASHAYLSMLTTGGRTKAPNYFGEGGITALRQHILAGGEFPITQIPQHHWPDGQPLSEM